MEITASWLSSQSPFRHRAALKFAADEDCWCSARARALRPRPVPDEDSDVITGRRAPLVTRAAVPHCRDSTQKTGVHHNNPNQWPVPIVLIPIVPICFIFGFIDRKAKIWASLLKTIEPKYSDASSTLNPNIWVTGRIRTKDAAVDESCGCTQKQNNKKEPKT